MKKLQASMRWVFVTITIFCLFQSAYIHSDTPLFTAMVCMLLALFIQREDQTTLHQFNEWREKYAAKTD